MATPSTPEPQFNFTEASIKRLPTPPEGTRATYRDSAVKGLELRITHTGHKSFSWYRRAKNRDPERVTIGTHPGMSVINARKQANALNFERDKGESPALQVRMNKGEQTFAQLFARYISDYAKLRKKTWAEDQQRYEQYLAKPFGKLLVKDIKRPHITEMHKQITAAGHPVVANRVLALISTVLSQGIAWSYIDLNEAMNIKRNREVARHRFIREDEAPRFFAALEAEPNTTVRDFFKMAVFTGARRANILEMKWADVALEQGIWRVGMTKNGTPQNVVLIDAAIDLLKQRLDSCNGSDFVFPGEGETGHLVEPKKGWNRIFDRDELWTLQHLISDAGGTYEPPPLKKRQSIPSLEDELLHARKIASELGIRIDNVRLEPARIHDLRRTNGSWQAMTGASLNVIGKSLNHKNIATTATYARLQNDPVRRSLETGIGAMLEAAAKPIVRAQAVPAVKPKPLKTTASTVSGTKARTNKTTKLTAKR